MYRKTLARWAILIRPMVLVDGGLGLGYGGLGLEQAILTIFMVVVAGDSGWIWHSSHFFSFFYLLT